MLASFGFAAGGGRGRPFGADEAVLLRNGVVVEDQPECQSVGVVLNALLARPGSVGIKLGGVRPRPGFVAAGIDLVVGSFAFRADDFEGRGRVLERGFVFREVGGERIGSASDAGG